MTTPLPRLRPGAEPRFYRGNSTGCLLLHGFMASPAEVGWLGDHLANRYGYTVYMSRLTGHGVDHAHMPRMRWQDWYAQALDGYHLLKAQCDQVYVIGHSMGGLLAFLLSVSEPVNGIISAATPMTAPNKLMRYARSLSLVQPYTNQPNGKVLHDEIINEQTRRGDEAIGRVHYDQWSTRAVYELYQLMQVTGEYLSQVTAPLLILTSANDSTVLPQDAGIIRERVKSECIETYEVQQGGHIIFQDAGREEAFRAVGQFIEKIVKTVPSAEFRVPGQKQEKL